MSEQFKIEYLDSGQLPRCPSNPNYPEGMDIPMPPGLPDGWPFCKVALPYPFPHTGAVIIECQVCGCRVGITIAGRPDDARSMEMPCKARQTH